MVGIHAVNGALEVSTPYNAGFVEAFKQAVPASDRSYVKASRVWQITPAHGQKVADLIQQYFHFQVQVPQISTQSMSEIRALDVRYIGATKERGDDDRTAFGWTGGGWNVIFPEAALREWFGQASKPGDVPTLYGVLGVKPDVADGDIRGAYRRMARQWHPDVCKEPDAAEQFKAIQHAYEILREPLQRRKYDAGLRLANQTRVQPSYRTGYDGGFRAPLRCGLILAEGTPKLSKFYATKIIQWDDIVNNDGQTLVTSWRVGADTFEENWS